MKPLLFMMCLLLLVAPAVAQDDMLPELREHITQIEADTIAVRDLEMTNDIERVFPTRQEALETIIGLVDEELPNSERKRINYFYRAFDFLSADEDYVTLYLDALEAQVAGFYNTDNDTMYTLLSGDNALGDSLSIMEEIVYAHEFTHALQDQHFDLTTLEAYYQGDTDRSQALVALIEGDATLVMNTYFQIASADNPLGAALQLLGEGFRTNSLTMPPGLPSIIEAELLFGYTEGLTFVTTLYTDGGWEAVNQAYTLAHLPQSTEQILHPQKYLEGELPQDVSLIAPPLPEGWVTQWDMTLGEFYLRQYLLTQLPRRTAIEAATGWGGDRVQVYHHAGSDALGWLMRLEWDTPQDADEFAMAYAAFGDERWDMADENSTCWSSEGEALCLYRDGNSTLLAYAPDIEFAGALIDSQA